MGGNLTTKFSGTKQNREQIW